MYKYHIIKNLTLGSNLPSRAFCLLCFVLICDAWEICLMFCKQLGQELLLCLLHKMKHISHVLRHQNTQTKGMG